MEENKEQRLGWKGGLAIFVAALLISSLYAHFGRPDLARPTLYSAVLIGITIRIKWEWRRRVWFWVTIAAIVAVHVAAILLIPWSTQWVPVVFVIPVGLADCYVMVRILSVVGKLVEGPKLVDR